MSKPRKISPPSDSELLIMPEKTSKKTSRLGFLGCLTFLIMLGASIMFILALFDVSPKPEIGKDIKEDRPEPLRPTGEIAPIRPLTPYVLTMMENQKNGLGAPVLEVVEEGFVEVEEESQ